MLRVLSILLPLLLPSMLQLTTVSTVGSSSNGRQSSNNLFVSAQGEEEEGYYLGKAINAWTFEDPDMKNPVLDAKGLTLSMIYPVSDAITYDMVKYGVYDRNCSKGQSLDEWFTPTLVSPSIDYEAGPGTSIQLLNVTIRAETEAFNNAPPEIASQWSVGSNGESGGRLQFCLASYVHTKGDPTGIVDGSETLITVTYDLTNGFSVETTVDPIQNEESARETFGPEGYWCDSAGFELTEMQRAFLGRAGGELSVCVVPNQRAIDAGLGLKRVDDFVWIRVDEATGGRVEQVAIKDGKVPGNGLTEMVCDEDGCGFKSILVASFFQNNLPPPTEMPSSAPSLAPKLPGMIWSTYQEWKCLDMNLDNKNIEMNDCNGGLNQLWDWDAANKKLQSRQPWVDQHCMREDFEEIKASACSTTQEFAWDIEVVGPGMMKLKQNRDGLFGLCAEIDPDTDNVALKPCLDIDRQIFQYTEDWFLINKIWSPYVSNRCLDLRFDTDNIYMSECHFGGNQSWDWDPNTKQLKSFEQNYCMREDFEEIKGGPCSTTQEFVWDIEVVGPGRMKLKQNRDGLFGLCAEIADSQSEYNVALKPCSNNDNQIFEFSSGFLDARRYLAAVEAEDDESSTPAGTVRYSSSSSLEPNTEQRDPVLQQAIDDAVAAMMKKNEQRRKLKGDDGERRLGSASLSGAGTATVGFKKRIFRRNLQGEESYEEVWDERKERFLQIIDDDELAEVGADGITAPFGLQLDIATGDDAFNGFFDDSSSFTMSSAAATIVTLCTMMVSLIIVL